MSALSDLSQAGACGNGLFAPAGSIKDYDLSKLVAGYKRTIASRYRAIRPDEVDVLPRGTLLVSPKIDGELWFLVIDGSQDEGQRVACVAPNGKVLSTSTLPLPKLVPFIVLGMYPRTVRAPPT